MSTILEAAKKKIMEVKDDPDPQKLIAAIERYNRLAQMDDFSRMTFELRDADGNVVEPPFESDPD